MNSSDSPLDAGVSAWHRRMPEGLLSVATQCRMDGLHQTIEGAAAWLDALLAGELPDASKPWPEGQIGRAIHASFPRELLRFTKGNKDLAVAVVENLLQIADGVRSDWENQAASELADWLKSEEERMREAAAKHAAKVAGGLGAGESNGHRAVAARAIRRKSNEIRSLLEGSLEGWARARMEQAWGERLRGWTSISEVFEHLQGEASFGWDLTQGFLRHVGWSAVAEMHQLLKSLPQIAAIARALGRAKSSEADLGPEGLIMARVSRVREELQWVHAPEARTHTDGIHKSDDVPRMLPMEGSLYRHPVFRKLWKAKYIERSLACYQIRGIAKRRRVSDESVDEERIVHRKLERGPIIVCLDTSGSMQGVPEAVAKAITLEAMRLAHAEGRECLLYAFSGPGDVSEHELDLSPEGIGDLCSFFSMSFHGGTDVSGPICKAAERLAKQKWRRADVILVSDGEFDVPKSVEEMVQTAKAGLGVRVHGLLINHATHGSRGVGAMKVLCDPVHVFRHWEEVRGL